MSEKIFPQDGGTGLDTSSADADWAAAAAVAALAAQGQSPFVVSGFGFTVDGTNDQVTVAEGQALLEETDLSDGRTTEMNWLVGAFPCRHPGATVTLYPDVDTDVYLNADIKDAAPDTLSIVSVDSEFGTPPAEPRLLLGTVHADESVTLENRVPSFDQLTVESAPQDGTDVSRKAETDTVQSNLDDHEGTTTNPHAVTASQAGAAPDPHDNTNHSTDYASQSNVDSHTGDTSNPHSTTLESARSQDNTLGGPVDAGGNDITNIGTAGATLLSVSETATRIEKTGSDQSIDPNTATVITFDDSRTDTLGGADLTNDSIVIQENGTYFIHGAVRWEGNSSWDQGDEIRLEIRVNDNLESLVQESKVGTNRRTQSLPPDVFDLVSGDVVTLRCRHGNTNARLIEAFHQVTWLLVSRLG